MVYFILLSDVVRWKLLYPFPAPDATLKVQCIITVSPFLKKSLLQFLQEMECCEMLTEAEQENIKIQIIEPPIWKLKRPSQRDTLNFFNPIFRKAWEKETIMEIQWFSEANVKVCASCPRKT